MVLKKGLQDAALVACRLSLVSFRGRGDVQQGAPVARRLRRHWSAPIALGRPNHSNAQRTVASLSTHYMMPIRELDT